MNLTHSHMRKMGRNPAYETFVARRRFTFPQHVHRLTADAANYSLGRPMSVRAAEQRYGHAARFSVCGWRDAYRASERAQGREPRGVGIWLAVGVRSLEREFRALAIPLPQKM